MGPQSAQRRGQAAFPALCAAPPPPGVEGQTSTDSPAHGLGRTSRLGARSSQSHLLLLIKVWAREEKDFIECIVVCVQ